MATTSEIARYLRPQGGYVIYGDDISATLYDEGVTPITQKEFNEAKNTVQAKIEAEIELKALAKAALLERLGITADEAALLLG